MPDIAQIIKYEGDNSTFIWKSPVEDFNTGTQLIVHESQEAVFFMNGQALDLFGPGRHTLETQNIPLVRRVLNKPTGDQTPFHCEVYFINKTEQMSLKWGTDSQVQYMDPTYNFPLKIGASGEMTLRVEDSRRILVKLVGTEAFLGQTQLTSMFRAFLMARIKPYLAQTMRGSGISIFDVDAQMGELSADLHKQLLPDFIDYGLVLERFFVTTVVKPDGDSAYEKFKELHLRQYADVAEAQLRQKVGVIDQQTQTQRTVIEAQGLARKRELEGFTYQQERGYDVAEKVAQNEGIGNFSSTGIGLGMMGGIAGGMGAAVAGITTTALNPITANQQGAPQGGFASDFNTPPPTVDLQQEGVAPMGSPADDMAVFKQRVEKLKMLKDSGMLSEDEFTLQRQRLLDQL